MDRILRPMIEPRPTGPSLLEIPLLTVGAEVTFATLVDLWTGAPPAMEGTVLFGVGLAVALMLQRASARRDEREAAHHLRDR